MASTIRINILGNAADAVRALRTTSAEADRLKKHLGIKGRVTADTSPAIAALRALSDQFTDTAKVSAAALAATGTRIGQPLPARVRPSAPLERQRAAAIAAAGVEEVRKAATAATTVRRKAAKTDLGDAVSQAAATARVARAVGVEADKTRKKVNIKGRVTVDAAPALASLRAVGAEAGRLERLQIKRTPKDEPEIVTTLRALSTQADASVSLLRQRTTAFAAAANKIETENRGFLSRFDKATNRRLGTDRAGALSQATKTARLLANLEKAATAASVANHKLGEDEKTRITNRGEIARNRARLRGVDTDRSNLRSAVSAWTRLRRSIVDTNKDLNVFSFVARLTGSRLALIGTAILAIVPFVLQLIGALAPLAGLLIALPALLFGAVAAMGAFSIATSGVSDAISAGLAGNTALFTKEMNKMPPAARTFVTAILSLRPAIQGLRATVSSAFFAPFAGGIAALARMWLPILQTGLAGVASAMGKAIAAFTAAARSGPLAAGVKAAFGALAAAITAMAPGISAMTSALGHLLTAGAPVLTLIGNGLNSVLLRFAAWLTEAAKLGKLDIWLNRALDTLGQVWQIVKNVTSAFGSLVKAASGDNNTLLDTLVKLTDQLATFLHTTEGQRKVSEFFATINRTLSVLWAILVALWPVIRQVYGLLADALDYLSKHKSLIEAIVVAWAAWRAILVVSSFGNAFSLIAANPWAAVAVAVLAVAFGLAYLAVNTTLIQETWSQVWFNVRRITDDVLMWIQRSLVGLGQWLQGLGNSFVQAGRDMIDGLVRGLTEGLSALWDAVTDLGDSILSVFGIEMDAHSPSRRMAAAGRNVVDGLVQGMRSQRPAVQAAVAEIGAVVTGMSMTPTLGALTGTEAVLGVSAQPVNITVNVPPGVDTAEAGRQFEAALRAHERRTGRAILATP